MGLFSRSCKNCGEAPELRVATIRGSAGAAEVQFTDFPYRACSCGEVSKWAFDPGTEFAEQLFFADGVSTAKGSRSNPSCRRCGAALSVLEPVELVAVARLKGFAPIEMRVRLPGYRCPSCGLEQGPAHEFDRGDRSRGAVGDGGRALDAAVASVGLST